jgi:hypothetical protein
MKEFALLFRNDEVNENKLTPEDVQDLGIQWQEWMTSIAAQGRLADPGVRLGFDGKTVKPGKVVTAGPYVEIKEVLRGLHIIRAESVEEATSIGKECPILKIGGNVEVRYIIPMNG